MNMRKIDTNNASKHIYIYYSARFIPKSSSGTSGTSGTKTKPNNKLQLMRSLPRCPRDPIPVRSSMNRGPNHIRKPLPQNISRRALDFSGRRTSAKTKRKHVKNSWKSPKYPCEILRVVHFQLRFQLRWTAVHRSRRGTARVSSSSFSVESQWLNSWVLCR